MCYLYDEMDGTDILKQQYDHDTLSIFVSWYFRVIDPSLEKMQMQMLVPAECCGWTWKS